MVREKIKKKLMAEFKPTHIDVIDESYRHNVPISAGLHFKVILVSARFIGERLLTRHRLIYGVLQSELVDSVYALELHTFTLKEWEVQQGIVSASPQCHGGWSLGLG
ncbi:DNA-binding transcriptional regulator BolA [Serratia symbiotica]|nr:DNA-binding transcriptional regulator BolA [Serratia symbiotica]